MTKKWKRISDAKVRHIWVKTPDDDCGEIRGVIRVPPDRYQVSGIPLCRCGKRMEYSHTEISETPPTMEVRRSTTVYITGATDALMDKLRDEACYWAEGEENICMLFEEAMLFTELRPFLGGVDQNCDVIVGK